MLIFSANIQDLLRICLCIGSIFTRKQQHYLFLQTLIKTSCGGRISIFRGLFDSRGAAGDCSSSEASGIMTQWLNRNNRPKQSSITAFFCLHLSPSCCESGREMNSVEPQPKICIFRSKHTQDEHQSDGSQQRREILEQIKKKFICLQADRKGKNITSYYSNTNYLKFLNENFKKGNCSCIFTYYCPTDISVCGYYWLILTYCRKISICICFPICTSITTV